MIAEIIVDHRSKTVDKPFDYLIPENLEGKIVIGSMVTVPFSKGNTEIQGFCIGLKESSPAKGLKEITELTDRPRAFDELMLETIKWMREKYLACYIDIIRAVAPVRSEITAKTRKFARLLISSEQALEEAERCFKRAPVQAEILTLLSREAQLSLADLKELSGGSQSAVSSLVKKGFAEVFDMETERDPLSGKSIEHSDKLMPTFEQKNAIERINHSVENDGNSVFLLHGVTGSGKTEVFMQSIEFAVKNGKTALVLVPEISLTPQMVMRFVSRFDDKIAVLHSGMSLGERYDQWRRIQDGGASIVIGARSAVFAPLKNIGVIIVDEEHSETYKSEMVPRYHAREVAIKRASQYGAAVILASATPSVESMYKARTGVYELITMKKRYNENIMPDVRIVDMRAELESGNRSMFSGELRAEITKNLENGEQTILFLNRRGFSTFVSCRKCGYVVKCPNCSISLTYHRYDNRLKCHYCGYERGNYSTCPQCASKYIRYFGGGTQKVEEEIRKTFPEASVLRMDVDTTSRKQSHERLIEQFEKEKTDILIGTQMVAKGLDFENVTLVGVISADTMLHIDDFRSEERTFAMLEQVAGRAGRGKKAGRAVIQTYTPDSDAVKLVKTHDYTAFYEAEIIKRKLMWYPPYSDIVCVIFSGSSPTLVNQAARYFLKQFTEADKTGIKTQILGPVKSAVAKMNNKYRYRIIIKCDDADKLNDSLTAADSECRKHKNYGTVSIVTDKNPNMMY